MESEFKGKKGLSLRVSNRYLSELVGMSKAGCNQLISPKSFQKSSNALRLSYLNGYFLGCNGAILKPNNLNNKRELFPPAPPGLHVVPII